MAHRTKRSRYAGATLGVGAGAAPLAVDPYAGAAVGVAAGAPEYSEPAPYSEPIYDSGTVDSGSALPDLGPLDQDPGWLALMAEYDRQMQLYGAEAQRQRGGIESERDRLMAELGPRGELEREGISGSMEARGLFGGGQMMQNVARQRANEGQRASGLQAGAAGRISDVEGELAMRQAELDRRRAEARSEYAARGYTV